MAHLTKLLEQNLTKHITPQGKKIIHSPSEKCRRLKGVTMSHPFTIKNRDDTTRATTIATNWTTDAGAANQTDSTP